MSGHSKWATTKRHKGIVDAKRANIFCKLAKNIMMAARKGGDPDMNFSLRLAIDKAKESNMPKDKIESAVSRGSGANTGETLEEVLYEAFGPSGVALLIEGITNSRNRTTGEIKAFLNKRGANLGAPNSVQWRFAHKGVIHLTPEQIKDKETLQLQLIDWGVDDVKEEDGGLTVYCDFANFEKIKKALEAQSLKLEYAQMEWVAKEGLEVPASVRESVEGLMEALEENDDVNAVYSNLT